MKIRTDFVTNSSSSSYIVAFDRKPKNEKEVQKNLFGNKTSLYDIYEDVSVPVESMTNLYKHILDSKPLTNEEIYEHFRGGYHDEYPDWPAGTDKEAWRKHEEVCNKIAKKQADKFIKANEGKKFYQFEVGDNHGDFMFGIYTVLDYEGEDMIVCPNKKLCHH